MDKINLKKYSWFISSIISTPFVLNKFIQKLGTRSFTYFPDHDKPQLIHTKLRTFDKIDEDSDEVVGIKGFNRLRLHLLNSMFRYSKEAPIAYIERTLEKGELTESVILTSENKNVYEVHKSKNAISELFESGLISVSPELKKYIGPSVADPMHLLAYRRFISKPDGVMYKIVEDLPDLGWSLDIYDKDGVQTHDYLQETLLDCKEFAEEEFDVPLDAWKEMK